MLRWARKLRSAGRGGDGYAAHSDFCAVFLQQLDRLFSLALILIGDELRAEECLLAAFDSCIEGSLVFKEAAVAWSRRSVIKCAIRFMLPSPTSLSAPELVAHRNDSSSDQDAALKYLHDLSPFDRFVFVISVLERYSDRECALLLDCSYSNILSARVSAFQQISPTRPSKTSASHASEVRPTVVDADWLECG